MDIRFCNFCVGEGRWVLGSQGVSQTPAQTLFTLYALAGRCCVNFQSFAASASFRGVEVHVGSCIMRFHKVCASVTPSDPCMGLHLILCTRSHSQEVHAQVCFCQVFSFALH